MTLLLRNPGAKAGELVIVRGWLWREDDRGSLPTYSVMNDFKTLALVLDSELVEFETRPNLDDENPKPNKLKWIWLVRERLKLLAQPKNCWLIDASSPEGYRVARA